MTPSKPGYGFDPVSRTVSTLTGNWSADFTASTVTYTISGRVTLAGAGLSGVTMTLGGSQVATTTTDTSGNYSFAGLAGSGTYTVTPSKTGYWFSPASKTYSVLESSKPGTDFVANRYPSASSVSPSSGGGRSQTFTFTYTDADGYADLQWVQAEINGVLGGSAGCVIYFQLNDPTHIFVGDNTASPSWRQGTFGSGSGITTSLGMCTLYPASSSRTLSGTNVVLNVSLELLPAFSGTKGIWMAEKDGAPGYVDWRYVGSWSVPAVLAISGRVTAGGTGLAGVTMTLTGTTSGSTTTDSAGNYSFTNLTAGGNYSLKAKKISYYCDPWPWSTSNLNTSQTANFTAKPVTVQMTNTSRPGSSNFWVGDGFRLVFSGRPGQTVSNVATFNGTTRPPYNYGTTDASGSYTLTGTMDTASIGTWTQVWSVGEDQATPTLAFSVYGKYSVSGQITAAGAAFAGVTVKLTGCMTVQTTTNSSGNYSFTNLDGNCSYTLTPSWTGASAATFTPTSRTFTLTGNRTDNFTALVTTRATLTNTTRGGTSFRVGDGFRVDIVGAPSQMVSVTTTFNGVTRDPYNYSPTSGTGAWSVSGTMSAAEIGTWTEVWKVGTTQATPTLTFTVTN